MISVFTKELLSNSSNGRQISISADAENPTSIHSATGTYDEVWLYATNTSDNDAVLTILFGGTDDADKIIQTIQKKSGLTTLIPGFILNGDVVVKAYASAIGILVSGFVNRVTAT